MFKSIPLKSIALFLILLASFLQGQGQDKIVSGKITDEKGAPVAGATIMVKGTSVGAKSNDAGIFSISVPPANKILVISNVGFVTQEMSITDSRINNIILSSTVNTLGDVVVVGYGSAKKKDVTGAVSNITSKDFNQGAILNPIAQIQGKVPGLVITAPSGDPNANPSIRLRGQTSLAGGQNPLIVVDGIPLDDVNQLSNIAAGDIASYDVLKDASATSIYGSRGANGVIMVTTKKGKAGQSKIEYSSFFGIDKQPKFLDLLTGDEWRKANPSGVGGTHDNGANTDWQRAVTRTAYSHSHTLSMSGGAKGFNYRGSVSYLNQEGLILNSGKNQIAMRFNGQQKSLNDKLELNMGVVASQTNRKFVAGFTDERLSSTSPALAVYNEDGSYNTFSFGVGEQNAVKALDQTISSAKEYLIQLYGTVDYEIIKHFKVGALGAFTNFNSNSHYFLPVNINGNALNEASRGSNTRDNARGDFHLNYLNNWGKHNLNLTGVYEYNYFTSEGFGANGRDYSIPFFQDNNLGT
ncbi:MAG: carboxypeptidase-like regulatory domain-containing protein, partial [Panacibacter sp.]